MTTAMIMNTSEKKKLLAKKDEVKPKTTKSKETTVKKVSKK